MFNSILIFIMAPLVGLMFWVFLHIGFIGYVSKREYYGSQVGCFALLKFWF